MFSSSSVTNCSSINGITSSLLLTDSRGAPRFTLKSRRESHDKEKINGFVIVFLSPPPPLLFIVLLLLLIRKKTFRRDWLIRVGFVLVNNVLMSSLNNVIGNWNQLNWGRKRNTRGFSLVHRNYWNYISQFSSNTRCYHVFFSWYLLSAFLTFVEERRQKTLTASRVEKLDVGGWIHSNPRLTLTPYQYQLTPLKLQQWEQIMRVTERRKRNKVLRRAYLVYWFLIN